MLDIEFNTYGSSRQFFRVSLPYLGCEPSGMAFVAKPGTGVHKLWHVGVKPNNYVDELRSQDRFGNKPVEHFNFQGNISYSPYDIQGIYEVRKMVLPWNWAWVNYLCISVNGEKGWLIDRDYDGRIPGSTIEYATTPVDLGSEDYLGYAVWGRRSFGWGSPYVTLIVCSVHNQCIVLGDISQSQWSVNNRSVVPEVALQRFREGIAMMKEGKGFTQPFFVKTHRVSPHCPLNEEQFGKVLNSVGPALMSMVVPDIAPLQTWGDLAENACLQCRKVRSNMFATLIELFTMHAEITDLVNSGKDFVDLLRSIMRNLDSGSPQYKSFKNLLTSVTNLRLSLKWGSPLTVKDTRECLDVLEDELLKEANTPSVERARASASVPCHGLGLLKDVSIECRYYLSVYYNQKDLREAGWIRDLCDWGLLSFENAWDMIPYSFVVDWFTQFGDNVRRLDSILYRTSFQDLLGSLRTSVTTFEVPTSVWETLVGFPISGRIVLKHYRRLVSDLVPLPVFSSGKPKLGSTQYLDGTSLILQRV
jgi:hypothetical protein